jgi:hypothetical protein
MDVSRDETELLLEIRSEQAVKISLRRPKLPEKNIQITRRETAFKFN